jgi:uncharacterized membrane protein YdjX (TVP38/TMEM64 family)
MGPPPTPIKLFEFCAGVFEMKVAPFLIAIFLGKMVQFTVLAVLTHVYGPGAFGSIMSGVHHHTRLVLTVVGLILAVVAVWVVRKLFDRSRGTNLPIEDDAAGGDRTVIVKE